MVGSTFAFFTATATGGTAEETEETKVNIQSAQLKVDYSEQNGSSLAINEQNIVPGWSDSKTITIRNDSEVDVDYVIRFLAEGDPAVVDGVKPYSNTFTDLYYTLEDTTQDKEGSTVTEGVIVSDKKFGTNSLKDSDGDDKNVLASGHLAAKKSYSFKLTITFKETNENQDTQKGATFTGKLFAEAFTAKPTD